jgi:ATP-dependent Zn protease
MVTQYGMNSNTRLVNHIIDNESAKTQVTIEEEVKNCLKKLTRMPKIVVNKNRK